MDFAGLYFSTGGRINRAKWWLGGTLIVIAMFAVSYVLIRIFDYDRLLYTFPGRLMVFVVNVAVIGAFYALNAKRFQDRNKPKLYAVIALALGLFKAVLDLMGVTGDWFGPNMGDKIFQIVLAVIGIWYFIELGCLRGTTGPNDYGPDPLEARRP